MRKLVSSFLENETSIFKPMIKKTYQSLKNEIFLIILVTGLISCKPVSKVNQADLNKFKFLETDITQLQQGYRDGTYTIKEVTQA